jgi:hypothetical protein
VGKSGSFEDMRTIGSRTRARARVAFASLSCAFVVFAVACGGGASGDGAKSPGDGTTGAASGGPSSGGSSDGTGSSSGGSGGAGSSSGGGGTTTTQLGDGGELQGAKLGEKTHTETETKGAGGPKGTHGQSASEPGRTAKDIQAIVASRRDDARACYDRALPDHPGIEGDLDVKWVIDPDGNVTDASVDTTKSTILEPSVGTCIVEVIKKIKFASSGKGYETRAHYPFNFHPKKFQRDGGH